MIAGGRKTGLSVEGYNNNRSDLRRKFYGQNINLIKKIFDILYNIGRKFFFNHNPKAAGTIANGIFFINNVTKNIKVKIWIEPCF